MIANYGPRLLPNLVVSDRSLQHVFGMQWWIQRLSGAAEFLTSDHPCVYTTGFADPSCVIALPLTPRVVFYAANRRDLESDFASRSSQLIAARTNQSVLSQSFEYVFAVEGNKKLLVAKHLRRPTS
jgi:hypothetical protein